MCDHFTFFVQVLLLTKEVLEISGSYGEEFDIFFLSRNDLY
jgi:hypothetical protein